MSSMRETVGKLYTDLKSKQQDKATVFEHTQTTQADFIPSLVALVEKDKHKTNSDLFVEVCLRRNQFMPDVIERYMKSRHTCPTPFFDRSVFHYDRKLDAIFFLWHVPSMEECDYYVNNALNLRSDEKEALQNVLDFRDGTLLRVAKKLNGEVNDDELTFFRKDSNGNPIATN